ncbi:MAG: 16S rRNA (cytidine(1402)-2'-O)-methyltransferase [Clostridiales bacterium]|nr:16S rRNA (cytidine(1402)-2'-O)-methyltransferase [Clostridiales bacterium]
MTGTLYLVATPIGNLQDITLRALETLKSVDIIACEDTRHTLKLLNHYDIRKPLISYYKGTEYESADRIIEQLNSAKNVALVSDAGMPCISDPGSILVAKLIEQGLKYTVIPGACAFVSALTLIGVDGHFTFLGFLPEKNKDKDRLLDEYKSLSSKLVFYSAPHDINKTLNYLFQKLGSRKVYLVKEITKIHENVIIGTLDTLRLEQPKGEFVVIVDGVIEVKKEPTSEEIKRELTLVMSNGIDKKQAILDVSNKLGIGKNAVYKVAIDL